MLFKDMISYLKSISCMKATLVVGSPRTIALSRCLTLSQAWGSDDVLV